MEKRYYWIKLHTEFFAQDKIDFLMSQKNGSDYVVLYQMLCLKTANNNGYLSNQIGEVIVEYDVDRIVRDCKYFSRDTVIVALELYKKLGLIFKTTKKGLRITEIEQIVGSESDSAHRVRTHRRKKALQCNKNVTVEALQCNEEIEIEKEKDILVGKNNKNNKYLELKHQTPARASESVENLQKKFEKTLKLYKNSDFGAVLNEVLKAFAQIVESAPKKFNGKIYNQNELQTILNNLTEERLLNIVKTVKFSEDIQDRELYFLGCFINSQK